MTDAELYEQAKRSLRVALTEMLEQPITGSFVLACKYCGWVFPEDITVGVAEAHTETAHSTGDLKLDLIWVGEGPPPKPNRAQRRRRR